MEILYNLYKYFVGERWQTNDDIRKMCTLSLSMILQHDTSDTCMYIHISSRWVRIIWPRKSSGTIYNNPNPPKIFGILLSQSCQFCFSWYMCVCVCVCMQACVISILLVCVCVFVHVRVQWQGFTSRSHMYEAYILPLIYFPSHYNVF